MARKTDLMQRNGFCVVGKLGVATGAAMRLGFGFIPDAVYIFNKTNPSHHWWFRAWGDANCFNDPGTPAVIASAGISAFAGSMGDASATADWYLKSDGTFANLVALDDVPEGIIIGSNAVLNTASDELYLIAWKNG